MSKSSFRLIEPVGDCLAKLLSSFGFSEANGCKCESRVATMNVWGADKCEENIGIIVGWLREAAAERGLPFLAMPARMLVRRAIANARKESQRVNGES